MSYTRLRTPFLSSDLSPELLCSPEEVVSEGKAQPSLEVLPIHLLGVVRMSTPTLAFSCHLQEIWEWLCMHLEFLSRLDFSMLCHFCYTGPWSVMPGAMTLCAYT